MLKVAAIALTRGGGTLRYAHMMANAMAELTQVQLVLSSDRRERHAVADGVQLAEVPTGAGRSGALLRSLGPWGYGRLVRRVREFDPDVVWFPHEHAWNLPLSGLIRAPVALTIHDPVRHPGEESRFYVAQRESLLAEAAAIVVLTRYAREALERTLGAARLHVIPHGTFPFGADAGALGPPPDTMTALFCGRILPYKGLDVLLRAFARVVQTLPQAHLIVAGAGNLAAYRAQIARTPNVCVINRYLTEGDLVELHRQADVVVLPHVEASQSGVIPLALGNGRPVIATDVGGLPEQFTPERSGLLVPAGDDVALAGAMQRVLSDPALARRFAASGIDEYRERFSWPALASQLFPVLRNAARFGRPRALSLWTRFAWRYARALG